jgi:hypothetical protein
MSTRIFWLGYWIGSREKLLFMEAKVRPIIVEKLEAFARRRRRLVMIRGGMASVTTLFVGMVLIAGLDWGIFLPDGVRYLLSVVVYGAALVVGWRLGIGPVGGGCG